MKTILITGCSTGFGRLAAERLAGRGDRVYATMRDVDGKNAGTAAELQARADAQGWDLQVVELDVTSDASVRGAADQVLGEATPDVVVNNAGQMYVGFSEAFTAEEFARQLQVNLVGIHRVTRAFLPSMRARGSGLFINLSSIAGRIGPPFFAIYCGSKWGVEGYSLGMRRELASVGIDVVVVEPGPFSTELFPQSPAPEDRDGVTATYPDISHGTFEELGAAIEGMFGDPETPTDPDDVVDRFVALMDMEPGTRPFRSVVGVDLGVGERNDSDEAHEGPFLEMMGLTDFARLRTS